MGKKKSPPFSKKKSTPFNWSDRSGKSDSFSRLKRQVDKGYSCWRCGARDALWERDHKHAADVEKRYLWPQRVLCRSCWRNAKSIRRSLGEFQENWARSKVALEKDKLFLSRWLRMLEELEEYGGKQDAARKITLSKLIRRNELKIWGYFRNSVDCEMIKQISEADYGYDSKEHLVALTEILSCGVLPKRLKWIPREVLELSKWTECPRADTRCLGKVFFCSVVLLAASETPECSNRFYGQLTEMIIAIDCANRLGVEQTELLYEFFLRVTSAIQLEDRETEEDYLYYHLSLYILSVMLGKSPDLISTHLRNTVRAEKLVENCKGASYDFFGHTFFRQRISLWRKYYTKYGGHLEKVRAQRWLDMCQDREG